MRILEQHHQCALHGLGMKQECSLTLTFASRRSASSCTSLHSTPHTQSGQSFPIPTASPVCTGDGLVFCT